MLTSKLYGDTDARLAISVDVVGLSYDSATGVLTIAEGYVIPSDEQVAEWAAAASALATHTADTDIHFAQGDISIQASQVSDFAAAADARIAAQKSAANGLATLDAGGKIPVDQLPASVMQYKGVWNASTNTPTLADGTGDTGDIYRVSVAGSQDLGSGLISFEVGDYAIYNGATWEKSDTTDAVASVNGLTGVVTLDTDNINEGETNQYFTQARARAAISGTITGLDYDSETGVWSLATGYVIPTTTEESNWNTAYGWGDHAGLYDAAGTAAGAVSGHESTYNHSLIASALQTETDPVVGAINGIVKADGAGNISAAVAGTDYLNASSQVNHSQTSGYVADEHINWKNATADLATTGSGTFIAGVGVGVAEPLNPLHVVGPTGTTRRDFIALFAEVGITPVGAHALSTNARKAIAVQGNGGAYFLGHDVTNDIEFIIGTSSLGAAFVGATTNHPLQLRTNNATRWTIDTSGHLKNSSDSRLIYFGAGDDASIQYDGTNLIINPKVVGTGILDVLGVLQTDGYNAADGTPGATKDVIITAGQNVTLHFKNGLFVGSD